MSEKCYIIYMHTNVITNKSYIGQTCQKLEHRWNNGEGYYRNPKFYNAIKKYGWNNFKHTILESNILSLEEANIKEQYWISFYNTIDNGYNVLKGGDNHQVNDEQRQKLSLIHKGKKPCKEALDNSIKARLGKQLSEEHKNKISMHKKGKIPANVKDKVVCLENKQVYASTGDACKNLGIETSYKNSNVYAVCQGKKKSFKGYHFMWYKDYINTMKGDE